MSIPEFRAPCWLLNRKVASIIIGSCLLVHRNDLRHNPALGNRNPTTVEPRPSQLMLSPEFRAPSWLREQKAEESLVTTYKWTNFTMPGETHHNHLKVALNANCQIVMAH